MSSSECPLAVTNISDILTLLALGMGLLPEDQASPPQLTPSPYYSFKSWGGFSLLALVYRGLALFLSGSVFQGSSRSPLPYQP